jgi:hypothetical protein
VLLIRVFRHIQILETVLSEVVMETHMIAVGICGDGASELENSNIVMLSEWLQ